MEQRIVILDGDSDQSEREEDWVVYPRVPANLGGVGSASPANLVALRQPTPLQNGAQFSGPGLPFDDIVSAAISSGIFNVGHTCNVAKRSTKTFMCRIECTKCFSRIILHLKNGLIWEVTQSGFCKKRVTKAICPPPTRPTVSVECCICYADIMTPSPTTCCKGHIFCLQCVESCFTMDVFNLFHIKFGGGGANVKGAWCSKCVEDCEEKDDVGWMSLRFGAACFCFHLLR